MKPHDLGRHQRAVAKLKSEFDQCQHIFMQGAQLEEIKAATGRGHGATQYFCRVGVKYGWIFSNHRHRYTRYFLSQETADKFDAAHEIEMYERKKARIMRRYYELRKLKIAAPKACLPKGERKSETPVQRYKKLTATNPNNVKPQICISNKDTRYTPVEPYQKVFSAMRIGQYL